jgi:hypothetical protein
VTARRSVRQFQTERRAAGRWLLRHPIGRSTQTSQADRVAQVEAAVRNVGGRSDETIITGGQRDSGASIRKTVGRTGKDNVRLLFSPAYLRRKGAAGTQSAQGFEIARLVDVGDNPGLFRPPAPAAPGYARSRPGHPFLQIARTSKIAAASSRDLARSGTFRRRPITPAMSLNGTPSSAIA